MFGVYGLVYEATYYPAGYVSSKVAESGENESTAKNAYGFVTYYGVSAATTAMKELRVKYGKSIFVQFAVSKATEDGVQRPKRVLQLHHCIELLNHYYGPPNWHAKFVNGMSPVEPGDCAEEVRVEAEKDFKTRFPLGVPKGKTKVVYAYETKVEILLADGRHSIGEGTGYAIGVNDAETLGLAKKLASSRARKDAFSRIAIVSLNGKTGIRILARSPASDFSPSEQEMNEMMGLEDQQNLVKGEPQSQMHA